MRHVPDSYQRPKLELFQTLMIFFIDLTLKRKKSVALNYTKINSTDYLISEYKAEKNEKKKIRGDTTQHKALRKRSTSTPCLNLLPISYTLTYNCCTCFHFLL